MIDNEHGDKNNVLVQWMSRDFLKARYKEMPDVTVGPNEYVLFIEDGKVSTTATQDKVEIPKLMRTFWHPFGKVAGDVQMAIFDTSKREVDVPFEAYSSDRDLIRGVVRLQAKIRENECIRALRLVKEKGTSGYTNNAHGYREFTVEDVATLLKDNIQYVIDTESISAYSSKDIRDNRQQICADIVLALKSKTPYWANYGLEVYYSTIELDDSAYDAVEKNRRQVELDKMELDLEYAKASGDSEQAVRLAELITNQKAAIKLDQYLAELNVNASVKAKEQEMQHDINVRAIDNKADEDVRRVTAQNNLEMMKALHVQELKKLMANSEIDEATKQVRLTEIARDIRKIQTDIEAMDRDSRKADMMLEAEMKKLNLSILTEDQIRRDEAATNNLLTLKNADHAHDQKMAEIENNTAKVMTDAENAALQAQVAFLQNNAANQHGQMIDVINAVNGKAAPAAASVSVACPFCGKPVQPGQQFCSGCGKPLSWRP